MKYYIDSEKKETAYIQLYRQVKEDIINGVYSYGEKLPSKRLTASETGVSTITVEHAYGLLCDEGYIESKERSGYIVIFRQEDGFMHFSESEEIKPTEYIQRSNDDNSMNFTVLEKTMRKVISEYGEKLFERSPNEGCIFLRNSIRHYLERSRGIKTETENIIIGSGAEYLYGLITDLLGRGKIYGIESPSYKKIEQIYALSDVKYESLPLSSDGINSTYLSRTNADILHVTPYRSFPSGVTASASKRHEYIRWANKNGRYIIEDDFESEFTVSKKPEETIFSISDDDNVIYMNTFSKTISPSLRVGYMVLPKHLLEKFNKELGFYSCTVPTCVQYVLAELISNGDFERHINKVRRQKRKELNPKR
ncbi:MAG: PLP-dependent aminotransferase family protein [Ruminococcaceae bacterium]|nr:PLP-dependent aminotransferase family protein [Oscillospiraceae bacterium]